MSACTCLLPKSGLWRPGHLGSTEALILKLNDFRAGHVTSTGFPVRLNGKESTANAGDTGECRLIPGSEDGVKEEMASIPVFMTEIPRTEEPQTSQQEWDRLNAKRS